MNLSNKILFFFFPWKVTTLSSCAALQPIPKTITQNSASACHYTVLLSFYEVSSNSWLSSPAIQCLAPRSCSVQGESVLRHCTQSRIKDQSREMLFMVEEWFFLLLCRKQLCIVKQQPYLHFPLVFYGIYAFPAQLRIHLKRKFWG